MTLHDVMRDRRVPTGPAQAPRRVVDTAPLTLAQQRLWLLPQVEPTDGSYDEMLAQRLRGPLSDAALQGASDDRASTNWLAPMGVDMSDMVDEQARRTIRSMREDPEVAGPDAHSGDDGSVPPRQRQEQRPADAVVS